MTTQSLTTYTPLIMANKGLLHIIISFSILRMSCLPATYFYGKEYNSFHDKKLMMTLIGVSILINILLISIHVYCKYTLSIFEIMYIFLFCIQHIATNLLESITSSFMIKIYPRKYDNTLINLGFILTMTSLIGTTLGSIIVAFIGKYVEIYYTGMLIYSINIIFYIVAFVSCIIFNSYIRIRSISKLFINKNINRLE